MRDDSPPTWIRTLRLLVRRREDGRVRTLWRIVVPVGGVLAVVFGLASPLRALGFPTSIQLLLTYGATVVVAVVLVGAVARYARRDDIRTYGFRMSSRWWRLFGLGVFVGFFGAGGALLTNLAFGWASVDTFVTPGSDDRSFVLLFAASLLTWLLGGVWEELVFRGVFIREAAEGLTRSGISSRWSVLGAWFVSAAVFGFLHFGQASSWRALSFWLLGGLVFGMVYILTGQLAIPIGIHVGFNVGATNLFGLTSVRAIGYQAPALIRPTFTGPRLFVEVSGIVNTVWLLVMGGLSLVLIHWQSGDLRSQLGDW